MGALDSGLTSGCMPYAHHFNLLILGSKNHSIGTDNSLSNRFILKLWNHSGRFHKKFKLLAGLDDFPPDLKGRHRVVCCDVRYDAFQILPR